MRRLYFHLNNLLGEGTNFKETISACGRIVDTIINHYVGRCVFLDNKNVEIKKAFEQELTQFAKTLHQGQKIVEKCINDLGTEKVLAGKDIFMLYDTYGFPIELTKEIADKRGVTLDEAGFETTMETAKEKSRLNTAKINTKDIDRSVHTVGLPKTQFI